MFARLWVQQLRSHIARNFAWNTLLLVALPALYVLLPQLVAGAHGYLRGSGYVPSEFERRVFADHWMIMAISAFLALVIAETQGFVLQRMKATPFLNAKFQALIADLAQRARLHYTPAIIFIPQGPVNAAATQSLFFGGKALGEEEAVFAHEMAHLVHRDVWPMLLLRIGSGGLAWQKWGLLVAMIIAGYESIAQIGTTMQFALPREFAFLLVAWLVTWLVHAMYKLGEMAHSRGREYLADAGAIALIGWDKRAQLITALLRVGHGQTGRSPFRLLRRTGQEIFMPHPAIVDRAEVLQVQVPKVPERGPIDHDGVA